MTKQNTRKRIVITGMGVVSCFGNDVDSYYDQLLAGKSGVREIKKFPVDDYPTKIAAYIDPFDPEAYIDKRQARRVDPCILYAMVAGKKALQYGNIDPETLNKERCGVIVGSGMGGMSIFAENVQNLNEKGVRRVSPFFVPFSLTNMPGGLLAIDLGFMGPNYSVSTACATSNYAFILAAEHIQRGEADLILCGGTEAPIVPVGLSGFIACKALSERNDAPQKASRPWDTARDGFVMGEGAGVLVMEELEHALKRGATIYAEYLGGAMSCDAYHMTTPRDDGRGVAMAIGNALLQANITPDQVHYINAHATSTPLGDLAELLALQKIFTPGPHLKINCTKSMIGHALGAAGALEAVASIKAIMTQRLHPTLNQDTLEEALMYDTVPNTSCDHTVNIAMSNSFGFGGHNSSVIFSRYQ
jgi:3-oxoacyl-[acyl-carrier-protein] synthase II